MLTILGDLDWHASSNGVKYLSASTKPACLGIGKADDWSLAELQSKKKSTFLYIPFNNIHKKVNP